MSLPAGVFNRSYAQDMAVVRTGTQWVWLLLLLVALVIVPQVVSDYLLGASIVVGIWIISALGLNILLGYCGQISMAQSAFMAVGGFTSSALELNLGLPFWIAWPAAALTAGVAGLLFGIPSLRIKGFYLALVTLAAQIIIMWIALHWRGITGGMFGVRPPAPEIFGFAFDRPRSFYYIVLVATVLATYFVMCLVRSRVGRAFMAIRDNDLAAEALGINVFGYKLFAFFLGCGFAGLAGALYVHYFQLAYVEQYNLWQSVWLLGMLVIGGMGSVSGTIFGVVFISLVQELTYTFQSWLNSVAGQFATGAGVGIPPIVIGLVIVSFLIFEPRGLAHRWELFKAYYRIWPFAWQEKTSGQ